MGNAWQAAGDQDNASPLIHIIQGLDFGGFGSEVFSGLGSLDEGLDISCDAGALLPGNPGREREPLKVLGLDVSGVVEDLFQKCVA
jgi:hypothetical protein